MFYIYLFSSIYLYPWLFRGARGHGAVPGAAGLGRGASGIDLHRLPPAGAMDKGMDGRRMAFIMGTSGKKHGKIRTWGKILENMEKMGKLWETFWKISRNIGTGGKNMGTYREKL